MSWRVFTTLSLGLVALAPANAVRASAWSMPRGEGQIIIKYEAMRADDAYDASGDRFQLLDGRRDKVASVLGEYGLTERLTLQVKGEWQSGRDGFETFDGRGPVEIGARWRVFEDRANVVSIYAGYSQSGEARNAGYARPGQGDHDVEIRLLAGRSVGTMFGEVQLARRRRDGLTDETRLDMTLGRHMSSDWMVMGQVYTGATDRQTHGKRAQWIVSDFSAVRQLGDWSAQLGVRATLAGRAAPASYGPVLAIWRRF